MRYFALIETTTGEVLNTLGTPTIGVSFPTSGSQGVMEVSEADFNAGIVGKFWDGHVFTGISKGSVAITPAKVAPNWTDTDLDPRYFQLAPGGWKDRLGVDYLAIAASDHSLCRAYIAVYTDREFFNLKDPRNVQMYEALIAAGQPAANPFIPGAGPLTAAKRDVAFNLHTTEYERHVKGLVQPL